jgi:hypothetical protein
VAACEFCGRAFGPKRQRSAEHAWAKWIGEVLPVQGEPFRHTVRAASDNRVLAQWSAREIDAVARRVCAACNGGWMSRLEESARPILMPLVLGRGCVITRSNQRTLATWATKTALALQLTSRGATQIPTVFYRGLTKDPSRPPPHSQVFLGAYEGHRQAFFQPFDLDLQHRRGRSNGYLPTFIIGHVVLQVFLHTHGDDVRISKQGARADMTAQIWPTAPAVTWPPPLIVDEEHLQYFMQGFGTPEAPGTWGPPVRR